MSNLKYGSKKRLILLIVSLIVTFALYRISLYINPNANLVIANYNIHHLYIGLILILLGGIPAVLFKNENRWMDFSTIVFGIGLSSALDEVLYLIATDGSDASYLLPISFWGALIGVGLAILYALILYGIANSERMTK